MKNFPKHLLGFYVRYAVRPFARILGAWFILFMVTRIGEGIFVPLMEKWFIAIFEQPLTPDITIWTYAGSTILLIFIIFELSSWLGVLSQVLSSRWNPKIFSYLAQVLTDYVNAQSMNFYTSRMSGKINSQINYVAGGFQTIENFSQMLSAVIVILLNTGLMFRVNSSVAIVLGATFVFRILYGLWRMKPMNKASKVASESSSSLGGKTIDSISNFPIIKLFVGAKTEKKYLESARKIVIRDRIQANFMQRLFWFVPNIVWDIAYACVLILCVHMFFTGEMKISEIVFTLSVFYMTMGAINRITGTIPQMVDVIGSGIQSYKELVKPIEIVDADNAPDLKITNAAIEIKNVTFKYGRKKVLDDLTLVIKPGEKVGLVGASGAGKTTLVNLLMRFYDPARGAIFFDGQNIRDVTQDSLRKNITFIPQEPALFNRTLFENIAYGNPDATLKEVRVAAKNAALDDFIMDTEKKYNSYVGDRGIKLSGGQKQRVVIARAFLKNAPVLILDEATSALDSETEAVIQKSFEKLSAGRTTIAIAHRLSTLRNMDKIVVMDGGRIIESGTHNQLMRKRGGTYARLWKMQSGGFLQE